MWPIFVVNRLSWQCCLAGISKIAPRILIFSIAMGADYSFELIFLVHWVPQFIGHNKSFLDSVLYFCKNLGGPGTIFSHVPPCPLGSDVPTISWAQLIISWTAKVPVPISVASSASIQIQKCGASLSWHMIFTHWAKYNGIFSILGTGKSLSEALIFASINVQYDKRLFMELP